MVLNKFLGIIIMVFGLIFASMLTAMVSNFVNENEYPPYLIKVINLATSNSFTFKLS